MLNCLPTLLSSLSDSGPILTDLGSSHGTTRNKTKLVGNSPILLKDGDVVVFGASTREYVVDLEAPDEPKQPATFNPLSGSSGGGGLNSSGNLAGVLRQMEEARATSHATTGTKRK